MNTLYISDLDGTLLLPGAKVGEKTKKIINTLLDEGENITFCTARNFPCAAEMLAQFNLRLPVALVNGALVYDISKKKYINKNFVSDKDVKIIIEVFEKYGLYPFIYKLEGEHMTFEYISGNNPVGQYFIDNFGKLFFKCSRRDTFEYNNDIVYLSIFEEFDTLEPVFKELQNLKGIYMQFYQDVNSKKWLIEIQKSGCNKKTASQHIKEYCKAGRMVAFGDNDNDIPMIESADLGIAVANCTENLRNIADAVIGSNLEEAVADFIKKDAVSQKSI
ncbi:MAG: HAD-IIB family hydrolase [Acutalibacteraceae bacterium]